MSTYQMLPALSDEEYAELRADIAEHGVRVPIDVDEEGSILDGHHRARIAAELDVDLPVRVVSGLTEAQKREHALSVNLHRRHLSREQRRELIALSLTADPHLSDREHARRTGASPTTVGTIRSSLEQSGDVSKLDTRADSLGRQQPATRPESMTRVIGPLPDRSVDDLNTPVAPALISQVGLPAGGDPVGEQERREALRTYLDASPAVQDAGVRRAIHGAMAPLWPLVADIPPERVVEVADEVLWEQLERYRARVIEWTDAVFAARRRQAIRVVEG